MRWPWSKPAPLPTTPYRPPITREHAEPEGIKVEEVDTSAMSRTGVFKAWKRLTGQPES